MDTNDAADTSTGMTIDRDIIAKETVNAIERDWETSLDDESFIFSKEELKEIIKSSISSAMITFEKLMIQKVNDKIESLASHVISIENRVTDLELKRGEAIYADGGPVDSITRLEKRLQNVEGMVVEAWHHANDVEQHGRKSNIRIRGLQLDKTAPCAHQVAGWVTTRLNVPMSASDIDVAHVLPQSASERELNIPPTIIVRFFRREIKDKVVKARTRLKGTKFVILEDITRLNYKLLQRMRNQHSDMQAWYYNGKCFAKYGNVIHKIQPFDDIQKIFPEYGKSE